MDSSYGHEVPTIITFERMLKMVCTMVHRRKFLHGKIQGCIDRHTIRPTRWSSLQIPDTPLRSTRQPLVIERLFGILQYSPPETDHIKAGKNPLAPLGEKLSQLWERLQVPSHPMVSAGSLNIISYFTDQSGRIHVQRCLGSICGRRNNS